METLKVKAHIGADGVLKLEIPTGLADREVDVVVVMQTTDAPAMDTSAMDENGWPIGFFDRTYGALADDPIERPPQLPLEARDPIE
ncbi:MAG TPA: hypothetical protein VHL11_24415 [Phototrophicaceae bacterium]|jgi:hypothetical protein|nr:hypothetical protein [Phototrophicaceae bacterium]